MGGGGSYYDRDVTDKSRRTSSGFSDFASQTLSRGTVDESILPLNRRLTSLCKSPFVYSFDVTGSMGGLPRIICDKWPMVAGQIVIQKYVDDVMVSLSAVGDVTSDRAPLQVCDFAKIRELDKWLEKLYLEGNGGGQHFESYEFDAYYYARFYEMKNAETPIFIFTGDESFREKLSAKDLRLRFGGQHGDVDADTIFEELKEKFKGNVFLIHRYYGNYGLDPEIVSQWNRVLGRERVVKLESDLAIADVTLGVIALASGSRTLDEYIEDVKSRPLEMAGKKYEPQSKERIAEVRGSLELLASVQKPRTPKKVKSSGEPKTTKGKSGKERKDWKI